MPSLIHFDDDQRIADLYRPIFESSGWQYRWYHHPTVDVLYEILQHPPDVFITDLNMPVMDGLALTRQLHSDNRTKSLPIVILTTLTSGQEEGTLAGASAYLVKSEVGPDQVLGTIQALIGRASV